MVDGIINKLRCSVGCHFIGILSKALGWSWEEKPRPTSVDVVVGMGD